MYIYSNYDQGRVYQNLNFMTPGAAVLVLGCGQFHENAGLDWDSDI